MSYYNTLIYQPILHTLLFLYNLLGHNLGFAIIALTLLVRGLLLPFVIPSLKSAKKMALLKPELDALKKKYAKDPAKLREKQLEFYRQHGLNPATGCLPYLVQLVVLVALYRVFMDALKHGTIAGQSINTQFWIWDLTAKDHTLILPLLAGLVQLLNSIALLPAIENKPQERKLDSKSKEDLGEMAQSMQQQMVFLMPLMTVIFAFQFPSGLALYWFISTTFSFVQQIIVAGPGGLTLYWRRLKSFFKRS